MSELFERQPPATRHEIFEVGGTAVLTISEVVNERAWIQSSAQVPVER